jgi:hypothetical protein
MNPDPNALYTKDYVTFTFAALAFIISLINLLLPQIRDRLAKRSEILKALRGERQAIADVAEKVAGGEFAARLKTEPKFRTDLIKALCMAYAVEGADRAKAFVFGALHHLKTDESCLKEITSHLSALEKRFSSYEAQMKPEEFKEKRLVPLQTLMASLKIPFDATSVSNDSEKQSTGA